MKAVPTMTISTSMTDYYQQRAPEYEEFYNKPERQADQERMKEWLREEVRGRSILEIACGTGYWTAVAAPVAKLIQATDYNSAPLEIARSKNLGGHVSFSRADAYNLPEFDIPFDCGMAHFWWSHILLSDQAAFLEAFTSRLGPSAKIVMIDNNCVSGSTIPITHRDEHGNTYQTRKLSNGDQYEVVKNFPSTTEIETALSPFCKEVQVMQTQYLWGVTAIRK